MSSASFGQDAATADPQPSKEHAYEDEQVSEQTSDQEARKSAGAAQVTIQLPESMQGNSLKMQELIMHLSQSGQLKDDSQIIIEVSLLCSFTWRS